MSATPALCVCHRYRRVRFDDVYLLRFDGYGIPQWGPADEATLYPTSKMAHAMKRIAKRYEGEAANIAVVVVTPKRSGP